MTTLDRLQAWYQSHCDGDWEHGYGVSIETLDNPGWSVRVELADTELEEVVFDVFEDRYEHDSEWLRCWKEDSAFHAACGPQRLEDALKIFLDWAEGHSDRQMRGFLKGIETDVPRDEDRI